MGATSCVNVTSSCATAVPTPPTIVVNTSAPPTTATRPSQPDAIIMLFSLDRCLKDK
jgi:hypothetical protein